MRGFAIITQFFARILMSIYPVPDWLPDFHTRIAQWYAKCGRVELPWRNLRRDGSQSYEVYISEIMLQQTQVSRVLEAFYFPFLHTFPSLSALADSHEQDVLRLWQGLGYYTRARNLRKCAQICVKNHNGALPKGVENLKKLPGIGAYSAGAISCFGFGDSVGFVDANIKRVFSRLFALQNPTPHELQTLATTLLDIQDSFTYNQALLDIGALVCKSKPLCIVCPIMEFCKGSNAPHLYPQKTLKTRESLRLELYIITYYENQTLYVALDSPHSRRDSILYAGLYNVPMRAGNTSNGISKSFATFFKHIGSFKHAYTKYAINALVFYAHCQDKQQAQALIDSYVVCSVDSQSRCDIAFVALDMLSSIPLSNLSHKALKCIPCDIYINLMNESLC